LQNLRQTRWQLQLIPPGVTGRKVLPPEIVKASKGR
jgi:hypothetical protein